MARDWMRLVFGKGPLRAALVWGMAAGCTTATAEGGRGPKVQGAGLPAVSEPPAAPTAEPGASVPTASVTSAAPSGGTRVFYDLSAHRDDAELFRDQSLWVDFGTPGDAKYTLGGWGTRVRGAFELDGVTTTLIRGSHGDVIVPVQFEGPASVHVNLRAPRDGQVTAYLGDTVVGRYKTDRTRFNVVRIELPPREATKGEHLLRLRASGIAPLGRESAALALDWLCVAPQSAALSEPPEARSNPVAEPLQVRARERLAYTFSVPTGARLVTDLSVQGTGRLTVRATLDDLSEVELGSFAAGPVSLDLGKLDGKVARLELSASDAPLTLSHARIEVPQVAAPKQLANPVRNVLVYLIDTLRADHLKPFNAETRVRTPGLDQLVALGSAVFSSAHTQENWTKPSVATLLSSLMPWEHHAVTTEAVVPSAVRLLPELLQERGFHTGAFIANGYVSDKFGFKQGFSSFRNYIREGRYSRAEFLAADVVEWLDKRPEKPFFLYVHAIDPHVPYKPTGEFLSLYDPLPYDGVVNFSNDTALLEKIKVGSVKLKDRDKVHLEALYDSEISYHDVHFRAILTALEKRHLADDTMVVVVADHGEEFWDHGSVGHGHSVYEELLRIPMVMRVPGLTTAPTTIHSSAGLVDVMPTVLEALGQAIPPDLSGRSLLGELSGVGSDAPQATVSGFMDGWRTVVIDKLKLIQRTERRVMVHDLHQDPHEQTDVAAQRPITTRYLRGQLGLMLAKSEPSAGQSGKKKAVKEQKTTIDAETEAQLQALGYVGSSRR